MQLVLAVSQWRSLTIAQQNTWDYVGLRNSLFTRPELSSVSHFLFTLDQDFLGRSNTKLRSVKHLGMCSLLRIYFGKRILSSFFFNNFGRSKSTHHWRSCYSLPKILIMKLMLLFKCRRSGWLQELKSDGQEISTIEWQELKNRFSSFFVHKQLLGR